MHASIRLVHLTSELRLTHSLLCVRRFAAIPAEMGQLASHAPTGELVEVITAGLSELSRVRPDNPAEWLAKWMCAPQPTRCSLLCSLPANWW